MAERQVRDSNGHAWSVDTLHEHLLSLINNHGKLQDERDRLYMGKFADAKIAVDDALKAQKELTNASFASSEKAIVKAEESQRSYNAGHNDLSRKMESQYALMMPRQEELSIIKSLEEKIESQKESFQKLLDTLRVNFDKQFDGHTKEITGLRETRSQSEGADSQRERATRTNQWIVGLCVILGIAVAGAIIGAVQYATRHIP